MRNFIIYFLIVLITQTGYAQSNLNNKYRLAKTYEQAGDFNKAKELYQELVKAEPYNNQFSNSLNEIYLKLKEYDQSIDLLEERIIQSPYDVSQYGMLGSTYYIVGDTKNAFSIWEKGISANKGSSVNYRIIANYAIQNRAFEKAIEFLEEGKKISNDPKSFSFELSQIYSATMNFEKAADEYCFILQEIPQQLEYAKGRMKSYLSAPGALEQSISTVFILAEETNNETIKELLTFLYIQNNQYDSALEIIIELESNKNSEGILIYNFAQQAYQAGKFHSAAEAYNIIIQNYPNSPFIGNSKIGYARTLEEDLNEKYSINSNSWKPYHSVDTAGAFEYLKILEAYEDLRTTYLLNEIANEAIYRMGLIKLDKFNDLESAHELFKTLTDKSPLSRFAPLSNFQLGKISIVNDNLESSKSFFFKTYSSNKLNREQQTEALFMLAKVSYWEGNYDESLSHLSNIMRDLKNDKANDAIELSVIINTGKRDSLNLLKFARADLLALQNKFIEAANIYKELGNNKNLILLGNVSIYKYAEMLIMMNDLPIAIEILNELSNTGELNIFEDKSLFLLANVYQYGILDFKTAISIYQKLLENFPNSLYLDRSRENIISLKTKLSDNI